MGRICPYRRNDLFICVATENSDHDHRLPLLCYPLEPCAGMDPVGGQLHPARTLPRPQRRGECGRGGQRISVYLVRDYDVRGGVSEFFDFR